ncbi:hypothetical protein BC833DRAFT_626762 [Globomyces pollinis-pini]|nr:hypothetical protein BC833DRAFT_626762 [Globomyces pollinis-pini]
MNEFKNRINELKKKAPGLSTDGSILTPTPNNNVIDSSTVNGSNNDVNKSGADKLNTSNLDISEFDTLPQVESENLSTPDQQFMKDMMSLERKPVVSNSEDKKTHPITPTQPTTQQHLNLAQSSTVALQPMFQQMSLNNTPYIAGMGHQSTYQIPNHYLPPLNSSGGGPQNSNIQPIIPPKPLSSHVPPIPPKVNQYIDPNRSTSNIGGTHTDSWDRSDQKPALPKSLTPQQKKMVDFQNMGFENEGIERAMKRYDNEQDILDFLVEFARYQSQGHHPHLCEVLINNSKESIFDERTFIKNTSNLVEMGFAIELVTDALLATKNKEDAALDALINYST